MAPLTILHISDLHRDPTNAITNKALLLSLQQDRDQYRVESPAISEPDLIVVSGDIVHGVMHDSTDAEGELRKQYDQAEEFLVELADSFVGGDRDRVVIIPGNHDVSFHQADLAMRRIKLDLSSKDGRSIGAFNAARLWKPSTPVRWVWGEFCFYEVTDRSAYDKRLESFCQFYGEFYQGKRQYSLNPSDQFDIFDYPELNVTILGLSSCHNNDPRHRKGEIHPESIAAACLTLRAPRYRGRLRLATWHHNTSGGPNQDDYMDSDILQLLINSDFSMGFHGHQHRTQIAEERHQFGTGRRLTVISAGTLCAGPSELPPGHSRSYNILEIEADRRKATLHQRKMHNDSFDSVIWGPGQFSATNTSHTEFLIQVPPERNYAADDIRLIGNAEALLRSGKPNKAAEILEDIAQGNPLARKILWDCYVAADDRLAIIARFYPPSSPSEIIYLADALWEEDRTRLPAMFDLAVVSECEDSSVGDIRNKYKARLGL